MLSGCVVETVQQFGFAWILFVHFGVGEIQALLHLITAL